MVSWGQWLLMDAKKMVVDREKALRMPMGTPSLPRQVSSTP